LLVEFSLQIAEALLGGFGFGPPFGTALLDRPHLMLFAN
jgi:hypothetical protein